MTYNRNNYVFFYYFPLLKQQTRKSNKQNQPKPQSEIQANQARQAAALALRNATMIKHEGDDDDDEEDNSRRRHGRRGGNRHKRHDYGKRHGKLSSTNNNMNNAEQAEQASGSNKR